MKTTISSRTPEGVPNRCPICDSPICVEPSEPAGDAPCPSCGVLLWFVRTPTCVRFYESEAVAPLRDRVVEIICENLGVSKEQVLRSSSFMDDTGSDSLDIVELVMELEEEFEMNIPDDEAQMIKTVGDVVDYIIRQKR